MTQSAVSQNIRVLEESLGITLFDRLKKKLIPTHQAQKLFEVCAPMMRDLENEIGEMTSQKTDSLLSGPVSLGLPVEYGNNIILPLLSKWGQTHPKVQFDIRYGHANEMNTALIQGDLDFAIVDSFGMDKRMGQIGLGSEQLALCSSLKYFEKQRFFRDGAKSYERLEYVDYVADAPVLKQWFRYHFKEIPQLNVRASLMNVQGMVRMICAHLGVGILPMHVVKRLRDQGERIYIYKEDSPPLENKISLAYLEGRTRSRVADMTMDFLLENLSENQGDAQKT